MSERPKNGGTVRTVRNRKTGQIVGHQALLPEALSAKPEGSTDERYREPLGPPQATRGAAERLLDVAILELQSKHTLRHGLPLAEYLSEEIEQRRLKILREGGTPAQAHLNIKTWKSMQRRWLRLAKFYHWPPAQIQTADLQHWFNTTLCVAVRKGKPLSGNFIQNVAVYLRAAFTRAGIKPNPADSLDLPKKNKPKVPHLDLSGQMAVFSCEDIRLEDRVMMGCAMGAGLRVNELLSLEAVDVHLTGANPYLMVRYGGRERARTKSRNKRRVELFEPGLGFWRLYMEQWHRKTERVFTGPFDGYLAKWPEQFGDWAEVVGLDALTSHYMRHSYAVSMLNGTWGYEPRSLEFIQNQLGHADIQTTEKYYGAFLSGTWAREARLMTGSKERGARTVITAQMLLAGRTDIETKTAAGNGGFVVGRSAFFSMEIDKNGESPSLTQISRNPEKSASESSKWWVNPPSQNEGADSGGNQPGPSSENEPQADPVSLALATSFADAAERAGVSRLLARLLYERASGAVADVIAIDQPGKRGKESA